MPAPIFTKLGVYIMTLISLRFYICIHLSVARQRLGNNLAAAATTRKIRRVVGGFVLYAVNVVSKGDLLFPETSFYFYE
jgi:hypothetical protein